MAITAVIRTAFIMIVVGAVGIESRLVEHEESAEMVHP